MQKTTLEQWRMFAAVVDAGGFNQASAVVHKSQSSIHHSVSKLEEALGVKLFEVTGRKVGLTDAGTLMLRRGRYLLEEAARIETVAQTLGSGVETELRIAIDGAFPQTLVHQALEKVSALYPQLNITMIDTVLSGTNELIAESEADIGLSPIMMSNGLNEEICVIDFLAVAHPDHPLHQMQRNLALDELKPYRQIVVRDSATQNKTNAGWLGAEQRWTVSNMRTSIDLVSQGLGYAWLPLPAIAAALEQQQLKPLPLNEGASRTVSFYLNFRDQDLLGPAAREFIGELRFLSMNMPTSDDR
ncbi:MAG: LysR family transcriptional regulator [Xanthomonadales bacterium]|nr:LysR family transcriptional regulator [Xanthomonadales bacterium]